MRKNYAVGITSTVTVLFAVTIALYFLGVFSKNISPCEQNAFFCEKFEEWVETGTEEANLSLLTEFEWDEVCFFGPYNSPRDVDWGDHEGSWMARFITQGDKPRDLEISRSFVDIGDAGCFRGTVLVKVITKHGRPTLVVRSLPE